MSLEGHTTKLERKQHN